LFLFLVVEDLFVQEEAAAPDVDFGVLAQQALRKHEHDLFVSPNVFALQVSQNVEDAFAHRYVAALEQMEKQTLEFALAFP